MYRVVLFLLFHFYTNSNQKYLFTVFSYFYTYVVPLHEGMRVLHAHNGTPKSYLQYYLQAEKVPIVAILS